MTALKDREKQSYSEIYREIGKGREREIKNKKERERKDMKV